MSVDPNELYYNTNSAQLSEGDEEGATDIKDVDTSVPAPIITQVSGTGIAPRKIAFNAATPSVTDIAATIEVPGPTTEEENPDAADLAEKPVARTTTTSTT